MTLVPTIWVSWSIMNNDMMCICEERYKLFDALQTSYKTYTYCNYNSDCKSGYARCIFCRRYAETSSIRLL